MHALACVVVVLLAVDAAAQTFNGKTATEWVQELGAESQMDRDRAVLSLVTMQDRAVRASLRALDDERPVVRAHAALTLGRLGAVAAMAKDKLVALQADTDAEVAKAAKIAALRVVVDVTALPALRSALQSGDWDLQLAAAEVLAQLGTAGKPAAPDLVALLASDDRKLDTTVVLRVPRARTQYWNVRQSAARALGAIGPVDGVPVAETLRATTQNQEWAAREGAVQALAAMPADEETVVAVLVALTADDQWPVRRAAAETLAASVPAGNPLLPKVVTVMILALGDDDGGVRRLAAEFLGARGAAAAAAVPALAALLGGRTRQDPEYALQALRALGPVAAPAKEQLLAYYRAVPDDQEWKRREVLEVLAAVVPAARAELPELEALLADREKPQVAAAVRRQEDVVQALAALQEPAFAARSKVLGLIVRERITEAIPRLAPWLDENRTPEEQLAALDVLTALDAGQIVPRVRPLLAAEDARVRMAAARSLAMFGDAESRPRVVEVLTDDIARMGKDELWFLGLTMVPELEPHIVRIVADAKAEPMRRWGAVQALGYLGLPASGAAVASLVDEVAMATTLPLRDRVELLAIGLTVLASLDPAAHRKRFAEHAKSDEDQVRRAALTGLAALGDAAAKAELARHGPTGPDVPEVLRTRLERTRVRLVQVHHQTLGAVLALLTRELDVPVVLGKDTDAALLDQRFEGGYFELLGYRPTAIAVLGVIGNDFFFPADLEVRFRVDRIELVPRPNPQGRRR